MQVNLCWWEWQQLEEHILNRPDIWDASRGLYSRYVDDVAVVGLAAAIPPTFNKYTQVAVTVMPLGWEEERAQVYFLDLICKWTSYEHRLKIKKLLVDELALPEKTASLMAIALEYINQVDEGGADPESRTADSGPSIHSPEPHITHKIGTFPLTHGGYVSLSYADGQVRCTLSVQDHKRYGAGFGHVLHGTLRALDGQTALRAAMIGGWDVDTRRIETIDDSDDRGAEQSGAAQTAVPAGDQQAGSDVGVQDVVEEPEEAK